MNIKIITMHAMHNPGSVLQAYALQRYLSNGNDVKIIDYRPEYFYSEGSGWKYFIKKNIFRKVWKSRDLKFSNFINANMNLTQRYSNYQQLVKDNLSADLFIVGSDQLWNMDFECGHDDSFYLGFVKNGKKISYATSIGKKNISDVEIDNYVRNLERFDSLSVREKSTSILLSSKLNRKVEWVCDPVLLLDEEEYLVFVDNKPFDFDYVLIYLSESSDLLDMIVEHYRIEGYKIILAGGFTKRCKCDIHLKDVGPKDFLTLIYYAKIVISSSFHATAFSHIFHKEFYTILPQKNGERIISLLNQSGLSQRGINNSSEFKALDEIIWSEVEKNLLSYITYSKQYLLNCIE